MTGARHVVMTSSLAGSASRWCAITIALALLALVQPACAGGPDATGSGSAEWVGTITTEGAVTTVRNESGSVWRGRGQLVEEAVIGVEAGAEEYMFGDLFAVTATDAHIYVTDEQLNLVRRYTLNGTYVDTIGSTGQGPGEYGDPAMVAVAEDGRIVVFDYESQRMQVYGTDGGVLDTWPASDVGCCSWPMLLDRDGALWAPTIDFDREARKTLYTVRVFGPEGPAEPHYDVRQLPVPEGVLGAEGSTGGFRTSIPFEARFAWTIAGPGRVLAGTPVAYRFEIQERGETVRVVDKYWHAVDIPAAYREWRRRTMVALGRRFEPGWSWSGTDMPTSFPAYSTLIAAASGETWVVRHRGSVQVAACADPLAEDAADVLTPTEACWKETFVLDVFDAEGRFFGEVDVPDGVEPHPLRMHIDGDRVVAVSENELGVIQVKRFRLVRPE